MAIDSAAKRFSMMGFEDDVSFIATPTGTVARQGFLAKYIGILFAAPVVVTDFVLRRRGWNNKAIRVP